MDSRDELIKAFEFIGQTVNDRIVDKCLELCSKYDIMIEDFVDQWSAFAITNLRNAPINLDGILLLERKELTKLSNNSMNSSSTYSSKETEVKNAPKNTKRPHSPENTRETKVSVKPSTSEGQHVEEEIDPDIILLSYSERSDSGQVVVSYGSEKDFAPNESKPTVNIIAKSTWYDPEKFRYLHATQSKVSNAFNDAIDYLSNIISKKNNLGFKSDVDTSNSDKIIYGRIRSEDHGRLNLSTVKLESSYFLNGAKTTTLNISQTKSFSLFPGQIVAVQGINTVGNSFIAQEFFTDGQADFFQDNAQFKGNLQIVVAAGPFTTSENFLYEPLQDLLKYVVETKPNVLILLGPFIDVNHSSLIDMTETFEAYFDSLIETIMDCFKFDIQVIIVSSEKDAHHHPIFPTPAYKIKQNYSNLICAPNPCLLNVNGVVMGLSSMDILFHLTKEEISRQPIKTDRLARMASHLLNQRCFYPLYPNDKEVVIDYRRLLNDCQMEVKPHILILPSTLRHCVKEVEKCLFINPERLVKNRIGGTFATLNINPQSDGVKQFNISCKLRKI